MQIVCITYQLMWFVNNYTYREKIKKMATDQITEKQIWMSLPLTWAMSGAIIILPFDKVFKSPLSLKIKQTNKNKLGKITLLFHTVFVRYMYAYI